MGSPKVEGRSKVEGSSRKILDLCGSLKGHIPHPTEIFPTPQATQCSVPVKPVESRVMGEEPEGPGSAEAESQRVESWSGGRCISATGRREEATLIRGREIRMDVHEQ